MKNITVNIGIPAYNESGNLNKLIPTLLKQNQSGWKLVKIYIANDGSTDDTKNTIKSIRNNKIVLLNFKSRAGKPNRLNGLFKLSNSDILVILDADIIIQSENLIESLVSGFNSDNIELVSGSAFPVKPVNFISKILYAGVEIWNIARNSTPNAEMYFCEGQIRAFRKTLYKRLTFPNKSADDVYPFLFLNDKSKFSYIEKAKSYYQLPLTKRDLFSQQKRYARSQRIQTKNFGNKIISKYFVITIFDKLRATLKNLFINPVWTILYLIVMVFIKSSILFGNPEVDARWDILHSTKK